MDYHGKQRELFALMFFIMIVQEIKFNKEFIIKMK